MSDSFVVALIWVAGLALLVAILFEGHDVARERREKRKNDPSDR